MKRTASLTGAAVAMVVSGWLAGCSGDTVLSGAGSSGAGASGAGGSTTSSGTGATPSAPANKVDLLLVVDNSRSMADKQEILALAVPDLVGALANPRCLDEAGQPLGPQPSSPLDPCAPGGHREFAPVLDVHVGVITSSLGGHGSDACPAELPATCGTNGTNNDRGRLISRTDPCAEGFVPTYQDAGFLAWDPAQQLNPPGEADVAALTANLSEMVLGAGQVGCGYESQLESWLRFLVDPAPYETIAAGYPGDLQKSGVDQVLLQQRAEFLRPDSALVILTLSDENDCSIIEDGQYYFAAQLKSDGGTNFHLPRARSECQQNPNDPCCASCAQPTPQGCPADPTCESLEPLSDVEDSINVRCWQQKRRFGIDFLYPVERYINALTQPLIDPASYDLAGSAVPNPLFSDLKNTGAQVRGADLVWFVGVVGVPWQAIARDPSNLAMGYKPATELDWAAILGDPANYVPAGDPHMIESIDPRPGLPTSGNTDPVHGHDYSIPERSDLQYACTFELPTPIDCTDPANVQAGCDCDIEGNDNPLCAGPTQQLQVRAKAHPGLRQLSVVHGLGSQGVAGSICADVVQDPSWPGYGYRPAVAAVVESIKNGLAH